MSNNAIEPTLADRAQSRKPWLMCSYRETGTFRPRPRSAHMASSAERLRERLGGDGEERVIVAC